MLKHVQTMPFLPAMTGNGKRIPPIYGILWLWYFMVKLGDSVLLF